jgi:hypothetical protein
MVEMVEGAHYRLDGGEEIGPALYLPRSAQDEKPWSVGGLWYRDDGRYRYGGNSSTVDLIEMTFDPRKDAASDRLTALEARVAELEKAHASEADDAPAPEPEAGPWKPKEGDEYFALGFEGHLVTYRWSNSPSDYERYAFGNVFPTREAANLARDRRLLAAAHERAAAVDRAKNEMRGYVYVIMPSLTVASMTENFLHLDTICFHSMSAAEDFLNERRADFERLHGEAA